VRPVNPIVEELRKARTTDENGEGGRRRRRRTTTRRRRRTLLCHSCNKKFVSNI
jgi:hypothetical protein